MNEHKLDRSLDRNANFSMRRENKFRELINKYDISPYFYQRLQLLQGFKIVFIFDDSGSMNTPLQESPLNCGKNLLHVTRWDELQYFANISLEIASLFDPNGSDVYFLNRSVLSPFRNVRSSKDIAEYFAETPTGFTPLSSVLVSVLNENQLRDLDEKKLLTIIVTDGEPTDLNGKVAIPIFKECLLKREPFVYTTIVACTDDESSVNYLNEWDVELPRLDVVDDYRSERTETLNAQGPTFSFSFGDYVVKSLVGSIDPNLDDIDEIKPKINKNCCKFL